MNLSLFRVALAALFTALIAIGSVVSIPLGPVPLVLANFFAILAGLLLGPWWGGAAVLVYLVLGAIGLPVFSGGSGGVGHFATPTGGFLIGYLAAAFAAGAVARGFAQPGADKPAPGAFRLALAGVAALVVLYAIGLPWFQMALSAKFHDLGAAFLFMLPFLAADAVKVAVAVPVARALRPLVA